MIALVMVLIMLPHGQPVFMPPVLYHGAKAMETCHKEMLELMHHYDDDPRVARYHGDCLDVIEKEGDPA